MKQYITYEQYTKQEQKIEQIKKQGVEFVYKKNKVKIIIGSTCLIIAIVPNGLGLIFYPLGFALLSSAGIDMYALIQSNKQKFRALLWGLRKRLIC